MEFWLMIWMVISFVVLLDIGLVFVRYHVWTLQF